MHILDRTAPGLADQLNLLPVDRRRRILAKACQKASSAVRNIEPKIASLLAACLRDNQLPKGDLEFARDFAESADEKSEELQEEDSESKEWEDWFYKARLTTAIVAAFGSSSAEDAADAVYELSSMFEDPSDLIAFIKSEIKAETHS